MEEGMLRDNWPIFAIECEPGECPFCLYGELPDDVEVPFELCIKHLDVISFILDKANIPVEAGYFD